MAKSTKMDEIQLQVIINGDRAGKTLGELKQAQKQLNAEINQTAVGSDAYMKKMEELKKVNTQLDQTRKEIRGVNEEMSHGKATAMELAGAFGIAFGIEQVVEFGKASVVAFMEAEENAHQLEFAVKNVGKEGEEAFNKLIDLSAELQGKSIFSDDEIQRAETMLANYGLTSDQITQLTPKIVNLATVQRTSLAEATETSIKAIEGQTKGLKTAGVAFSDTGNKVGNFNTLLQKLDKFSGASQESITTWEGSLKQSKNTIGDLMENVGEFIVVTAAGLIDGIKTIGSVFTGELFSVSEKVKSIKDQMEAVLSSTNKLAKESDLSTLKNNIQGANKEIELYNKELDKATKAGNQKMINDIKQVVDVTEKQKAIWQGYYDSIALQEKAKLGLTKLTMDELEQLNTIEAKDEIKRREDARKKAEDEIEKSRKDYQNLQDEIQKIKNESQLLGLDDKDKELKQVDLKYDALIKRAKGHEKDMLELKELHETERAAVEKKHADKKAKQDAENAEKELKLRTEIQNKVDEANQTADDKELVAAQIKWQTLIAEAEKYGIDVSTLRMRQYEELHGIIEAQNEATKKQQRKFFKELSADQQKQLSSEKAIIHARAQLARDLASTIGSVMNIIGGQTREMVVFQKGLALVQIAIDTAESISSTIAEASKLGWPAMIPAVIGGVASVMANIATAKNTLKSAGDPPGVPRFAEGGFTVKNGGLTPGPYMAMVGEAGTEHISPNWMVKNPQLAPVYNILENIRKSGQQSATAIASNTQGVSSSSGSSNSNAATGALYDAINRLNAVLENGVRSYWDVDYYQKSSARFEAAKSSATIASSK